MIGVIGAKIYKNMYNIITVIVERDHPYIEHGWGNGYVLIPPEHPWHGLPYDNIPVDVHGGLTFGSSISNAPWVKYHPILQKNENRGRNYQDYFVYGFDTAHLGDGPHLTKEWVLKETQYLAEQFQSVPFKNQLTIFQYD